MKRLTAFFTIAILVCIATFVAFASNQNRDKSTSILVREGPDDDFPGQYSYQSNSGVDSQGPLYSAGYSNFSYFRNDDGDLRCSAGAVAYVSCSSSNANYRTTYTLYAKVPELCQNPNVRNPQTLPRDGSFSHGVYRYGQTNGNWLAMGGSSGSASASGKNLSNNDQHVTSAASPTPETARDLEIRDYPVF